MKNIKIGACDWVLPGSGLLLLKLLRQWSECIVTKD